MAVYGLGGLALSAGLPGLVLAMRKLKQKAPDDAGA
jgi:hypothetical protein